MAFNLEEWNKLSEAEHERRYKQRLRNEERGKNIAAFLAFILICALLIYVFTGSRGPASNDEPVAPARQPHFAAITHWAPSCCVLSKSCVIVAIASYG